MVHSSRSEAPAPPGLERDCRQDEYPTRDLGLQDEFPTAYNIAVKNFHNADPPVMPNTVSDLPLSKSASKIQKRVCGIRASTFWLVTALVVLLVVAGVVAGVLGSKISSKNNDAVNQERYVHSNRIKKSNIYSIYMNTQILRLESLGIAFFLLLLWSFISANAERCLVLSHYPRLRPPQPPHPLQPQSKLLIH